MKIEFDNLVDSILAQILPHDFYALDFTHLHYENLLTKLEHDFSSDEIKHKRGTISRIISSYFMKTDQKVTIRFTENMMVVDKKFKKEDWNEKHDRADHEVSLKLLNILNVPDKHKPLPHMWVIAKDIRSDIEKSLIKIDEYNYKCRDDFRKKISDVFELSQRDIVLFLNSRIYIREYVLNKSVSESEERRYCGLNVNILQDLYEQYFPNGVWEKIELLLPEVLEDKLNFSFISNQTFINEFILAYKAMIDIILLDAGIEETPEIIDALSGFLLRKYLDAILIDTAKNLMNYVTKRDKNAEMFIKYYTDDVVIDSSGNKKQKYAITDEHGQRWNYSSVLSVLLQYDQGRNRQAKQEYRVEDVEVRVRDAKSAVEEKEISQEKVLKEFEVLAQNIRENELESQSLSTNALKSEKEITDAKTILGRKRALMMDEQKFLKETKDKIDREIKNKLTEYNNWTKRLKSECHNLENIKIQNAPVKEMYTSISKALAKTMIKR